MIFAVTRLDVIVVVQSALISLKSHSSNFRTIYARIHTLKAKSARGCRLYSIFDFLILLASFADGYFNK